MTTPPDLPVPLAVPLVVEACPFCAAPGMVEQMHYGFWHAMCSDDACAVIPRYFRTQAEALKVWNHRPVAEARPIVPESTIIGVAA